ncbi:MAG: zf-HC2 domain-containing protein [Phycisphaerae bacterium]|nr:zf-HC2 domain-containing protein [Phycisphaerae bacterium]
MECRDTERLIDAYLDRELPAETASKLEAHLSACQPCRRQYGSLVGFLTKPEPIAVPAGLAERIAAAIESPEALTADRDVRLFEAGVSENGRHARHALNAAGLAREDDSAKAHVPGWHGQARRPKAGGFARGADRAALHRWLPWAVAAAACLAFFLIGWFSSRVSQKPEQQIAVNSDTSSAPDAPEPIIVSPLVLASWAQAVAMGGPAIPLVPVVQAAATEAAVAASFERPLLPSPRQPTSREVPPPVMELPQELLIIPHVSRALGV